MKRLPDWVWMVVLVATGVAVGTGFEMIPVALLVLLAGTFLLLRQPAAAVLVYAASRPLVDLAVFVPVGGFTLGQVWGAGLLAVTAWYWLSSVTEGSDLSSLGIPLFIIAVYALLTLGRGDDMTGVMGILKLGVWTLLIPTAQRIAMDAEGRRAVLNAGLCAAAASVVAMAVAYATNRYGAAYYAGQSLDVGQGPHGIASTAVMCLPLLLMRHTTASRRTPYLVLGLLLGVGIVMSLVRTTLVGYMVIMLAYVLWFVRRRGARSVVTVGAAVTLLGAAVYFMQDALASRLGDLEYLSQGGTAVYMAGGGRIGVWLGILGAASRSWRVLAVGVGPGASYAVSQLSMGVSVWAHNDFLELLLTGGVVLLSAYVLLLGWLTHPFVSKRSVWSDSTSAVRWVGLGTAAAFVFMAFFNGMFQYQASIIAALFFGYARAVALSGDIDDFKARV